MVRLLAVLLLLLPSVTFADNLFMRMDWPKAVDVIEGPELNSFSVSRPDLLPAPCSGNRIQFDATEPTAQASLGMLLESEYEDSELLELEYQYGTNGQCVLRSLEEAEPKDRSWKFEDLFPQSKIWIDPQGIPRLISLGCPDPWNIGFPGLHYEFMLYGSSRGDTMRQYSGDICVSNRSEFLGLHNWSNEAKKWWRICRGNECTPFIEVTK